MSKLSDLRMQLVGDLVPVMTVPVYPSWPDVLDPPCAFVAPPLIEDYAVRGPNFGEITIALDLVLLVPHGTDSASLTALEGLIETALINTADWALAGVDSPAPTTVSEGGAEYLASVMHLRKAVLL